MLKQLNIYSAVTARPFVTYEYAFERYRRWLHEDTACVTVDVAAVTQDWLAYSGTRMAIERRRVHRRICTGARSVRVGDSYTAIPHTRRLVASTTHNSALYIL
jgi:hypothetical protein